MKKKSKFLTFILSAVPGLGQIYLGYGTRGAMFFSALVATSFITLIFKDYDFQPFKGIILVLIPIIWLSSMVDSMILADRINSVVNSGELSSREAIIPDYEKLAGQNKKIIAMFLSIIPGTGHLYLGLKVQGIEIMTSFFLVFYLGDWLKLGILVILIPIIWFYSMFDVMHKASSVYETLVDENLFDFKFLREGDKKINNNKILGIVLIVIGVILILNKILIPVIDRLLSPIYRGYIQTTIVSIIFIAFGIRLLIGHKLNKEG